MAKRKISSGLKWILNEAKKLRKKYPKRFATWKEYVSQASAIYAKKHHGKSPVGKKHKIGAVKLIEQNENTNAKPKRIIRIKRTKKGIFKKFQVVGSVSDYNRMIFERMQESNRNLKEAEQKLNSLLYVSKGLRPKTSIEKAEKRILKSEIKHQRKNISQIKHEMRMQKALLR
jgi:hypothetical protein